MKKRFSGKASATQRRAAPNVRLSRRPPAKVEAGKSVADFVKVTADQRQHLIEDLAFFRADRYRETEPGKYRKDDRREAEAEIAEALKTHGVR